MRTAIVRKIGPRNWSVRVSQHAVVTNVPTSRKALQIGDAMSMLDNPLVGEYTKGISRGARYFVDLERRIRAEKVPMKPFAEDLQSELFRKVTDILSTGGQDRSGARSARFSSQKEGSESCKAETKTEPEKTGNRRLNRWKRVQLDNLSEVYFG
jgi:hypothetical protein